MVAPGSTGASFDVLLQFSLDEEAQKRVENRTSTIADELQRIQKEAGKAGAAINDGFRAAATSIQKTDEDLKKVAQTATKTTAQLKAEARALSAEASAIASSLESAQIGVFKNIAGQIEGLSRKSIATGGLIIGGILAEANRFAQDAKNNTAETLAWRDATDQLAASRKRVDAILVREALPLIKQAASFASQAADVVEKHPEIVQNALNAGKILITLGTLGVIASKGIKLVADVKYLATIPTQLTAAKLQDMAADKQLQAAGLRLKELGLNTNTGGVAPVANTGAGAAGLLNSIGAIAIGLAISKAVVDGVNAGLRATGLDKPITEAQQKIAQTGRAYPGIIPPQMIEDANKAKSSLEDLSTSIKELGGSRANQDAAVQAFSGWKQEDARIVQDAMEARKQIIAEGEAQIVSITANYTAQRTSIEQQYSQEAAQITTGYQADVLKAEQDYVKERAQIVEDGADRIREIQEEEQKKREEIERDYSKAAAAAADDRNALALVQAQEARDEALAEAESQANEAIAREKRETQERLAELAVRYAQERQQRQQQYEADLKENAARRAAALKEAADRYQAELKQAREANAAKLKEAAEAANRERIEKRNQFIAQLGDLGIMLNSERQTRQAGYNAMLGDLSAWIQQMGGIFTQAANSLGTASGGTAGTAGTTTNPNFPGLYGTHDYSGYAYTGLYKMAQDGKKQWVLGGNDTRAAEQAVGGQLTQANMAQMIALMTAMRGSAQYTDNASYGRDLTTRQIRDIKLDNARMVDQMLGGY